MSENKSSDPRRNRRMRNWVTLAALLGFCALLYFVSIARMTANWTVPS